MNEFELNNTDPEDVEDLIVKIEKSFNIQFMVNELAHVETFGELCDEVRTRINLNQREDCTSQQAFYKLRSALAKVTGINKESIAPNSFLLTLLPRSSRRAHIGEIERILGFKINVFRLHHFVSWSLGLLFLASLIGLMFVWEIAFVGVGVSISGFWIASKTKNELNLKTVGQLAEKIARENYIQARRRVGTYNPREVDKVIADLFSDYLDIDKSKLTKEAKLF